MNCLFCLLLFLVTGSCSTKRCQYYSKCFQPTTGEANCRCPSQCENHFQPVCGSNLRTYQNYCFLKSDSCKQQLEINKIYNGVCSK